ncbi:MAG: alpha-1,2-fucosyltransferase [Ferruginibacter sp.]
MVIVKLWGGLGNQLFQYALYLSYKEKGVKSKLDKSFFESVHEHNGYELEKVFGLHPDYASTSEKITAKAISKFFLKPFNHPYDEKKWGYGYYNERVANLHFGYLKGYWQTEKYFKAIEEKIKKQFIFPSLTDEENITTLKKITATNSVSIHIRRGDYLHSNRDWAMNIDYYKNAIQLINQKIQDPYFFIFSDDMNWVKENIILENVVFVDWNKKENSFIDMQLMSACKHNIIANSSFSWWGAWLNANPNKIVIAPDNWVDMQGTRDVLPEEWIQLPADYFLFHFSKEAILYFNDNHFNNRTPGC